MPKPATATLAPRGIVACFQCQDELLRFFMREGRLVFDHATPAFNLDMGRTDPVLHRTWSGAWDVEEELDDGGGNMELECRCKTYRVHLRTLLELSSASTAKRVDVRNATGVVY
jgi:hypothetical protein